MSIGLYKIVAETVDIHRQMSTNFDNFWQKDRKRSKYMRGALIFHLT